MAIKIRKIDSLRSDDAKKALEIRKKVFVEEQGVDPRLEYDAHDVEANHYLVLLDNQPVGAARWRKTEYGIKLERFAVLPEYRNKGMGEKLLERIMKDVKPLRKKIYLHAQLRAVPYYERAGFVKQGETFFEADIEHCYMEFAEEARICKNSTAK